MFSFSFLFIFFMVAAIICSLSIFLIEFLLYFYKFVKHLHLQEHDLSPLFEE